MAKRKKAEELPVQDTVEEVVSTDLTEEKAAELLDAPIEDHLSGEVAADKEEITQTLAPKTSRGSRPKTYVVVSEFRDKNDFNKFWTVGSDVSSFSSERLERLINLGYVEQK